MGLVDELRGIKIVDNELAKKAIDGALWTLVGPSSDPMSGISSGAHEHAMISYCWSQKEKMKQLANYLKGQGIPIWIDIEQMEGSVLEAMAGAVENSTLVIIGLSSQYKESQACRTEAEYTYKLKKPVICLMVEENYQPKGWLGALLGSKLWYNPWGADEGFEAGMAEVTKQIKRIFGEQGRTLITTPNALPSLPVSIPNNISTPSASIGLPTTKASQIQIEYEAMELPTNIDLAIPTDRLQGDQISLWSAPEVARWLKMKQYDIFIKPFLFHKIDGKGLVQLSKTRDADAFLRTIDHLHITLHAGIILSFQQDLQALTSFLSPFALASSSSSNLLSPALLSPDLLLSPSPPLPPPTNASGLLSSLRSNQASPTSQKIEEVSKWTVEQTQKWVEDNNLNEVAKVCKKYKWDGRILVSFNEIRKEVAFNETAKDFGIKDPVTQACLRSELIKLFS